MYLKRFILASLLSVCLGLCSVSSVFASTATGSDAVGKSDQLGLYRPLYVGYAGLLGASGTISPVANTVNRTLIYGICYSSPKPVTANRIEGSYKYFSESGSYSFISDSHNVKCLNIVIPAGALPRTGAYMFSYSWNSDVTAEIENVDVVAVKTSANAAQGTVNLSDLKPDHVNNAGEFALDPVLVDFKYMSSLRIVITFKDAMSAAGGTLNIRYAVSNTSGGTEMGFTQSTQDSSFDNAQNTAEIANNTAQIASAQNETNSKLDQIVQHISDQLFALWNQIAAYLITPWMEQDRTLHSETINTIEDLDTNVTTTIEQKTEWHANFIIEGLKSLFIPSDQYFQTKISEMQSFFEEKLGFLGYTLTYFIRLLNGIMNASQNSVIRFPGIHAPNRATGEDYVLLPAQDVDLGAQISQISEGNFNLLEFCRTAGDIVLVLSFLVLLQDKLREVEQ